MALRAFEYRLVILPADKEVPLIEHLNILGREGWETVNFEVYGGTDAKGDPEAQWRIILKREVVTEAAARAERKRMNQGLPTSCPWAS